MARQHRHIRRDQLLQLFQARNVRIQIAMPTEHKDRPTALHTVARQQDLLRLVVKRQTSRRMSRDRDHTKTIVPARHDLPFVQRRKLDRFILHQRPVASVHAAASKISQPTAVIAVPVRHHNIDRQLRQRAHRFQHTTVRKSRIKKQRPLLADHQKLPHPLILQRIQPREQFSRF